MLSAPLDPPRTGVRRVSAAPRARAWLGVAGLAAAVSASSVAVHLAVGKIRDSGTPAWALHPWTVRLDLLVVLILGVLVVGLAAGSQTGVMRLRRPERLLMG